jgi:hypothetical protein
MMHIYQHLGITSQTSLEDDNDFVLLGLVKKCGWKAIEDALYEPDIFEKFGPI